MSVKRIGDLPEPTKIELCSNISHFPNYDKDRKPGVYLYECDECGIRTEFIIWQPAQGPSKVGTPTQSPTQ